MSEQLAKIAELKKQYEDAVKAVGRDGIQKLLAPLFEQFPTARGVRWRQYTPYFNDGEPCTFRCNADYAFVDFGNPDTGDFEDGFQGKYESGEGTPERAAVEAFQEALDIDADVMLAAFGDHKVVTITREGIEVDDYDHE